MMTRQGYTGFLADLRISTYSSEASFPSKSKQSGWTTRSSYQAGCALKKHQRLDLLPSVK